MAVEKHQDQKNIQDVYPSDTELTPFTLNILRLESILFRVEMELGKESVGIPRLNILMSEASSLREELMGQKDRAIASNGMADLNVQRFLQLLPTFQKISADMLDAALQGRAHRGTSGDIPPPPVDNGTRSADDGGMNDRITKLEVVSENTVKALDAIQRRIDDGFKESRADFRIMVGIQITTLIAILGVLAKAAKMF